MQIKKVKITNYRCFENLELSFDDHLTLLVGRNGSGKSSILDAVTVSVGALMTEFKMKAFGIRKTDARNVYYTLGNGIDVQPQYPVSVYAEGVLGDQEISWTRELRSHRGHTVTCNAEAFKKIATLYLSRVSQGDGSLILPIISYYGTGRLWAQMREKQKAPLEKTYRLNGYLDSLDAAANNKLMLQWFRKMTLRDLQNGRDRPSQEFVAVKKAISRCFEGLTRNKEIDIRFNLDSLELEILYTTSSGEKVVNSLNQLSDGYKSSLSLIADIAYRMSMLNPQLMDQVLSETPGIVLIDEVDLHLHPAWQRRILNDLMDIFPKVQFIVSSHAPAVIQSVERGRLLLLDEKKVRLNIVPPYGYDTNSVMSNIMGVSVRPESVKQIFDQFYHLMDTKEYAKAETTLDSLSEILGEFDPEISACRISLKLEKLQ